MRDDEKVQDEIIPDETELPEDEEVYENDMAPGYGYDNSDDSDDDDNVELLDEDAREFDHRNLRARRGNSTESGRSNRRGSRSNRRSSYAG